MVRGRVVCVKFDKRKQPHITVITNGATETLPREGYQFMQIDPVDPLDETASASSAPFSARDATRTTARDDSTPGATAPSRSSSVASSASASTVSASRPGRPSQPRRVCETLLQGYQVRVVMRSDTDSTAPTTTMQGTVVKVLSVKRPQLDVILANGTTVTLPLPHYFIFRIELPDTATNQYFNVVGAGQKSRNNKGKRKKEKHTKQQKSQPSAMSGHAELGWGDRMQRSRPPLSSSGCRQYKNFVARQSSKEKINVEDLRVQFIELQKLVLRVVKTIDSVVSYNRTDDSRTFRWAA
jgi:hypothetical protein